MLQQHLLGAFQVFALKASVLGHQMLDLIMQEAVNNDQF